MDYVRSVPGDNAHADAVNLLLSAMNDHDMIANTVVDRQPNGCLVPVLAEMTTMLVLTLASLHPDDREHTLRHFASQSLGSDDPIEPVRPSRAASAQSTDRQRSASGSQGDPCARAASRVRVSA